jgi:hypothetical protein
VRGFLVARMGALRAKARFKRVCEGFSGEFSSGCFCRFIDGRSLNIYIILSISLIIYSRLPRSRPFTHLTITIDGELNHEPSSNLSLAR